jgi:hypothetical protein
MLLLGAMALCGCQAAHDVAVTSFRVIDAPANYVRRKIDQEATTTTTTTTTTASSDAVTPGRTVQINPNQQPPQQRQVASTRPPPTDPSRVAANTAAERPRTSTNSAPRTFADSATEFPTAKAVPGKPGYVYSPFDPSGGYVDVNGFTPGSKVKDPYSGKIFLVP